MNGKFGCTAVKILCVALALILTLGSAGVLLGELGDSVVAFAKSEKNSEQANASVSNDLTSGSNLVYLPNYDTEVITKTNLPKPTVKTFGDHDASYYPSYTNQIKDFDEAKQKTILAENKKMLDEVNGWFAAGTLKTNLKKHVSADGQFSNAAGNYDDAPRIEKVVTVNSKIAARKRSLGVFAPGGEVITITIDESLTKAGLTVNIGYPYKDECDIGSTTDRWKNDRMAQFFLEFKLTETVTYIGSPLGGMITLNGVNSNLGEFDVTVSGGVDMPDYKLGVSTKEDWQNILAAPGPYVWMLSPYQYFVMPKTEISDIEDPYNAMLWWHKASMISMYSMAREDTGHFTTPVISVFDSYVYVGEGVAKVWAFVTNAPKYWCHGMLDYDNLMRNGSWGAIHEYNHHHQSHAYASAEWGVGGHDEITNNVVSALSYILLTDVAATRSESNQLNGWGAVADPYCNYKRLANATNGKTDYEKLDTNKLFGFVDMMHTFGVGKFIEFLRAMYGYGDAVAGYEGKNLNEDNYLTTQDGFTLFASLFYKTDFTDYFTDVWHFNISEDVAKQIRKKHFDKYFSVTNLYSVGIKGVETGRPYQVSADEPTVLKLDEFTLCSTDNYKLTKVSKPKNGKLDKNGDGTYTYTPSKDFTEDSFELTYKVKVGRKSYNRTLVVRLAADAFGDTATKTYPAVVDFRNQYLALWYSEFLTRKPAEIRCVDDDGNDVKTVSGANTNAMFDGNPSTGFHTAWQGSPTEFPHNYYFTFDGEISFNSINFTFQDNGTKGYYAIGEYEIYTSKDGESYKLLTAGKNEETNFSVQFDKFVTTQYVKLVVKNNAAGKNFTSITEIQFLGANYNVYSSDESLFSYDESQWTDVVGSYVNGTAKHTANGKVSFYMTGTELVLYSTNAESKITIDGKEYTIEANDKERSPSFVIGGLKNKKHLVEIEGNDMTFDMIKISIGAEKAQKSDGVNWGGLGVSIAAGVALLGAAIAVIVFEVKRRKVTAV